MARDRYPLRRLLFQFDWSILFLLILLAGTGLVALYSVSVSSGTPFYQKQFYFLLMGVVLFTFILLFHYHHLESYGYYIYAFSLLLLVAVLLFGKASYGAKRWLDLGFFSFQPSEVAKISVIIALAKYLSGRDVSRTGLTLKELIVPAIVTFLPLILVAVEPDLGTALIILFISGSMILFAGIERKTLMGITASILSFIPFMWLVLKDYQKERILAFLDPELDPLGSGYQIIQSKIAVGSGGILGKGFLRGTQGKLKFLPAQHTDFIFSIFAEEWGLLGSFFLLSLYLLLLLWGINVVRNAGCRFGAYLAFGLVSFFFFHVFINIGMVIGLLPVVGVPLPFMSYGGSFLVVSLVAMGMLFNVSMRRFMF